jgi:hypothetical protein
MPFVAVKTLSLGPSVNVKGGIVSLPANAFYSC